MSHATTTPAASNQLTLDGCVARCSAFHDFDELIASITAHGYVPTLRRVGDAEFDTAVENVRGRLQALGHAVYPASL
jgi:hypothetical protein